MLVFGMGTPKYGSVYKRLNKIYHHTLEQKQTPPVFFHFPKVLAANSTTEERLEITPLQSGVITHPVSLSFFKINATDVNKLFVLETALSGEPGEGPLETILKKYGRKNEEDLMYHGAFSYSLELPREELLNLFRCIKDGNYKIKRGSGIMYDNEIWILYETK